MNFPSPTRCFTNETNNMSLKSKNSKFNFGNKSIEKSLSVPIDVVWFRLRLFMSSDFCTWTLEGAVSWGKNPSATIVGRLQLEQITMLSNQNYSFFEELQNPSYYELPLVLFTWNAMWQFQQKNTSLRCGARYQRPLRWAMPWRRNVKKPLDVWFPTSELWDN